MENFYVAVVGDQNSQLPYCIVMEASSYSKKKKPIERTANNFEISTP